MEEVLCSGDDDDNDKDGGDDNDNGADDNDDND